MTVDIAADAADKKQKLIDMGRLYECFEAPVELDLKRKKQLNMGKPWGVGRFRLRGPRDTADIRDFLTVSGPSPIAFACATPILRNSARPRSIPFESTRK